MMQRRLLKQVSCLTTRYYTTTTVAKPELARIEIFRPSSNPIWLPTIQKLLYDVYIKEQNWAFSESTPSGIWADHDNGLLHDDFMEHSTWFLALTGHGTDVKAFGCVRLIEQGAAEVFGYASTAINGMAINRVLTIHGASGVVEINRLAVSSEARTSSVKVGSDLLVAVFRYLASREKDERPVVATAAVNSWVPNIINSIPGVGEIADRFGDPFYYESTDPEPVQMLLFQRCLVRKSIRKYLIL